MMMGRDEPETEVLLEEIKSREEPLVYDIPEPEPAYEPEPVIAVEEPVEPDVPVKGTSSEKVERGLEELIEESEQGYPGEFAVERAANEALEIMNIVDKAFRVENKKQAVVSLKDLEDHARSLAKAVAEEGVSSQVVDIINQISQKLSYFARKEGYDLGGLLEDQVYESSRLKAIIARLEEIQAASKLLKKMGR